MWFTCIFSLIQLALDEYNAIWTLFIIQLQAISVTLEHALLGLNAPLYGREVSVPRGDHRDRELN